MLGDEDERPTGTNLRGRLSDVYFPSLVEGTLAPLATRLGERATLDDARLGRAAGLAEIQAQLAKSAEWLGTMGAVYTRAQFAIGIDRDVTEGILTVKKGGGTVELPVAVVAERRRSREVEVRVYYAAHVLESGVSPRPKIASGNSAAVLPSPLMQHIQALRQGDVAGTLGTFEENGTLRDAEGRVHAKSDGSLRSHYEAKTPWDAEIGGYADDGRTCALECAVVRIGGRETPAQAALIVYERGDSGLICAARAYSSGV
jgi:hypothetical protein